MKQLIEQYGRETMINVLSRMITENNIQFPYKKYTMGDVFQKLHTLQNFKPNISNKPFTIPSIRFYTRNFFPFTFKGEFITFVSESQDYDTMDIVTDYFQEEARLSAVRKDTKLSPLQYWKQHNKAIVAEVISRSDFNTYNLRETIYKQAKECTQFKPSLVVSVIKYLKATRMLDFSAGWGDRLVGAIAGDVKLYCGVDPNTGLQQGHSEIINTFAKGNTDRFKIIYSPFQTAVLPEGVTFDLVFTSPPYFDFEIYTERDGQSVKDFPYLQDWIVKFLLESIHKAWQRLDTGGHLAIHLTDFRDMKVCEVMNLFIQYKLEGSVYCGVLASSGLAEKPRPIWVWQKQSADRVDRKRVYQAEGFTKQYFRDIYFAIEKRFPSQRGDKYSSSSKYVDDDRNEHVSKKQRTNY